MNCSLVTELLSEYVDDALDPSIKVNVEEHLAHCRTCADELVRIRTYLHALESLPKVRAPVDFLASLHERLERPSLLKHLLIRLFYPIRIKIPFEVAGLVAASLLVVLLYRGVETEKARFSTPPAAPAPSGMLSREFEETKKDEPPSASTESSSKSGLAVLNERQKKSIPRTGSPQEAAKTPAEESILTKQQTQFSDTSQKPVELVLRLAPANAQAKAPGAVLREQPSVGASSSTVAPQVENKTIARNAAPAPMRAGGKAEKIEQASPATTFSRIKELVEHAGGSVLSVNYEKDTQSPEVVSAQVPAAKYPSFLNELRSLGELEEPAVKGMSAYEDTLIRVQIRFVPPG